MFLAFFSTERAVRWALTGLIGNLSRILDVAIYTMQHTYGECSEVRQDSWVTQNLCQIEVSLRFEQGFCYVGKLCKSDINTTAVKF